MNPVPAGANVSNGAHRADKRAPRRANGSEIARHPALVSVIIPAFNGDRYLADAIQSVVAQTYRPLELIVIDDGSTDRTADVVRAFDRIRYAFQAHAGLGAALNHGVRLARGAFFAFLDADDLWPARKLTKQMSCFEGDECLDIVFGHVRPFVGDERPRDGEAAAQSVPGYSKGTMLVTREAFMRVGPFDPGWRVGDFVDWYVRALDVGLRSLMLADVLLYRRIHGNNMGVRDRAHWKDYARILKRALDRGHKPLEHSDTVTLASDVTIV